MRPNARNVDALMAAWKSRVRTSAFERLNRRM
jgi:hypothetical protein